MGMGIQVYMCREDFWNLSRLEIPCRVEASPIPRLIMYLCAYSDSELLWSDHLCGPISVCVRKLLQYMVVT